MPQVVAPAGIRKIEDVDQALDSLAREVNTALADRGFPSYTVANLPRTIVPFLIVFATDASTGVTLCWSDGTDWIDSQTGIAVTT